MKGPFDETDDSDVPGCWDRFWRAVDDGVGKWPIPAAVLMSFITSGLAMAFVKLLQLQPGPIDPFFTADTSPDNTIIFLLGVIYSIDYGVKYVCAIQSDALLECNEDLFKIFVADVQKQPGKQSAFAKPKATSLSSQPNAHRKQRHKTSARTLLNADGPYMSVPEYPGENIMFLTVNKAQAAYMGHSILNFREENKLRWYVAFMVLILHVIISPLFMIGKYDIWHLALSCLLRSFLSYFVVALLFQTTYTSEKIVNRRCVPYRAFIQQTKAKYE